jgi:ribose 5-phosphate isomerase B
MIRVGIAADHGGFLFKQQLIMQLGPLGFPCVDYGATHLDPNDDYPDLVIPLAQALMEGKIDRGLAICGSGVGACIAANKVPGVRACLIHEYYSAHQSVEHDNLNLMCLGEKVIGSALALDLVLTFLNTRFTGEPRHQRRLNKIAAFEQQSLAKILSH